MPERQDCSHYPGDDAGACYNGPNRQACRCKSFENEALKFKTYDKSIGGGKLMFLRARVRGHNIYAAKVKRFNRISARPYNHGVFTRKSRDRIVALW